MISPWEIYLVFQLDSIREFLAGVSGVGLIASIVAAAMFPLLFDEDFGLNLSVKWVFTPLVSATFVAALLYAFVPSTKTAAAMIIIPKIANSETIQREAEDLYGLAKRALVEAVQTDEPEKE